MLWLATHHIVMQTFCVPTVVDDSASWHLQMDIYLSNRASDPLSVWF